MVCSSSLEHSPLLTPGAQPQLNLPLPPRQQVGQDSFHQGDKRTHESLGGPVLSSTPRHGKGTEGSGLIAEIFADQVDRNKVKGKHKGQRQTQACESPCLVVVVNEMNAVGSGAGSVKEAHVPCKQFWCSLSSEL